MAYATVADVNSRIIASTFSIGTSTKPSETEVERWLDEATAVLNSCLLAAGYSVVPVTGDDDLITVRGPVANRVALQVLTTKFSWGKVPESLVQSLSGWRETKKMISDGNYWLPDQPSPSKGVLSAIDARKLDGYSLDEFNGSEYG